MVVGVVSPCGYVLIPCGSCLAPLLFSAPGGPTLLALPPTLNPESRSCFFSFCIVVLFFRGLRSVGQADQALVVLRQALRAGVGGIDEQVCSIHTYMPCT